MVFSHHERKRVPDVQNTLISKELGRRWKSLSEEEREPYKQEAERLQRYHKKEFPDYKYKPMKRSRPAARATLQLEENAGGGRGGLRATGLGLPGISGTLGSRVRVISGPLKPIDSNRLHNKVTIDKKFKSALNSINKSSSYSGFRSLSTLAPAEMMVQPSPPAKVPELSLQQQPTTPDPHSQPFYGDSRLVHSRLDYSPHSTRAVPTVRSCPVTPLSRLGSSSSSATQPAPPSPLFSAGWADLDSSSLPDLSSCLTDILPPGTAAQADLSLGDLRLDWADTATASLDSLVTLDQEIEDNWIDAGLRMYVN